jgi:hypothetical protein
MILKLDKGDTNEIFKEFVDEATREYINSKIKSLFDKRVEEDVKNKLARLDLHAMFQGKISQRVDEHFKPTWRGQLEYVDKQIEKKLESIDFEKMITDAFATKVADSIRNKIVFLKK